MTPRISIRPCQIILDTDGTKTVKLVDLIPHWKHHYIVLKATLSLFIGPKYTSLEIFDNEADAKAYADQICDANGYKMYDPVDDLAVYGGP